VSRREAAWTAAGIFVAALLVRVAVAGQIVFPKPEDTAYYFSVARNLIEGRGLVSERALELPDAAAGLPAAGVRGLAAAAVVPCRDPDGGHGRDVRRVAVDGDRPRRDRARPRLALGRRRRRGA
jgi:hypothetical protein